MDFAIQILVNCGAFIHANQSVEALAKEYTLAGILPVDALHLASAVVGGCDYFCSCDDKLIKKVRLILLEGIQIRTPLGISGGA